MLDIVKISKTFSPGTPNAHKALNELSLHLDKGDFVTVIGTNGAGKSTLFNAICGNFMLDAGSILLNEQDITFLNEHKRALHIGRVFQDPMRGTAPNLTVLENLAIAYARTHRNPLQKAIQKNDVAFFKQEVSMLNMGLEDRMDTKVGLLSGGQRQAVSLLMSTIATPKLLLLDEHTAALDPAAAEKVLEITQKIVKEKSLTTMMVTHNIEQSLKIGKRTIMMNKGAIIMDISGQERKEMDIEKLLQKYKSQDFNPLNNDRMLFDSI